MADAARTFGHAGTVEHGGRAYTVAPLNLDMLARFEAWLEDRAWRKVERARGRVSADLYRERLDAVARLVASGAFAFSGAAAAEASKSDEGLRYLFFLALSGNPGMDEALAGEIYEEDRQRALARVQSASGSDEESPDPEAPSPEG